MKKKIQEVEQYFRDKLVSGDYEVAVRDSFRWEVLVDGEYTFTLWIGNGANAFTISDILKPSYMFFTFTEEESKKGWAILEEQIALYKKEVVHVQKLEEYERLKKELNIE